MEPKKLVLQSLPTVFNKQSRDASFIIVIIVKERNANKKKILTVRKKNGKELFFLLSFFWFYRCDSHFAFGWARKRNSAELRALFASLFPRENKIIN